MVTKVKAFKLKFKQILQGVKDKEIERNLTLKSDLNLELTVYMVLFLFLTNTCIMDRMELLNHYNYVLIMFT
jgi:hypothetical protein